MDLDEAAAEMGVTSEYLDAAIKRVEEALMPEEQQAVCRCGRPKAVLKVGTEDGQLVDVSVFVKHIDLGRGQSVERDESCGGLHVTPPSLAAGSRPRADIAPVNAGPCACADHYCQMPIYDLNTRLCEGCWRDAHATVVGEQPAAVEYHVEGGFLNCSECGLVGMPADDGSSLRQVHHRSEHPRQPWAG